VPAVAAATEFQFLGCLLSATHHPKSKVSLVSAVGCSTCTVQLQSTLTPVTQESLQER
jgi:hypothetical protein